jgi:transglutaminase-like putative cysteine protease
VLWDYDGRAWRTLRRVPYGAVEGRGIGQPVTYNVIMEPHRQHWLFLLGLPAALPDLEADMRSDFLWLTRAPVINRLQYSVTAWLDYRYGLDISDAAWTRALDLPDDINPRARSLAMGWANRGLGDAAIVQEALQRFRQEPFVYTLQPPKLGDQAVDDFLFNTRRGFCEHYASAFVFLMRAAGIPARVVTGYQGGEYNAVGNYWIVRQRDAHAWAEVWLEGEGWRRVDPTAAVAPTRVELGVSAALPATERPAALINVETGWLAPARLAWDLVNYRWNLWVLGYNDVRQREFLSRLAPWLANLNAMLWLLGLGSALFIFGLAGFYLLRQTRIRQDPASRLYARFCRKLERLGIAREPSEGPAAFARRAAAARPDLAGTIGEITQLYVGLRYGRATAETLSALRQCVRRFRPRGAARES